MAMKDRLKNMFQISRGRAKQKMGSASGDKGLEREGMRDQSMGHLKQVGEEVKDALKEP